MAGASIAATIGALALVAAAPVSARAAGALFGQPGVEGADPTIVQSTAVFVPSSDATEVHLRLEIEGATELMSWVIPVPAPPSVTVGSEAMFGALDAASVSIFRWTTSADACATDFAPESPSDDSASSEDETRSPQSPPTIGWFSAESLADVDSTVAWLQSGGTAPDPLEVAMLESYAAEGMSFLGVRLDGRIERSVVHPVVLRFESPGVALPLSAMRFASAPIVDSRVLVLADERYAPLGMSHVELNRLQVNWLQLGPDYGERVGEALDTSGAQGRGFVTEYVGPVPNMNLAAVRNPSWDPDAFAALDKMDVPDLLVAQELYACEGGPVPGGGNFTFFDCDALHPLADGLLADHYLPDGVTLADFFNCPECYLEAIQWNAEEFIAAYRQRILSPGDLALARLGEAQTLTRMYARLSPNELDVDPSFIARPADGDASDDRDGNAARIESDLVGNRHARCNGDAIFTLPGGREVLVPGGGPWPDWDESMPHAERVLEMVPAGSPLLIADNTETIDTLLAEHNAEHGWPPQGCGACRTRAGADRGPGAALWLFLLLFAAPRRRRESARPCPRPCPRP